jgi:hypothetical protein
MPLSNEIQLFLSFFKLSPTEINHKYLSQLKLLDWNWRENTHLMEKTRLSTSRFESNEQFYQYIQVLSNSNNRLDDYYPLFLQIIDIIDLEDSELDEHLSNIFLGSSIIHTGCAEFHT